MAARPRLSHSCLVVLVGAALSVATALAGQHPRLLITPEDIPRLRHACGIGPGPDEVEGLGRAGSHAAEFQSLRNHFTARQDAEILPGELTGAAFLHLVDPDDPLDRARIALVNRSLQRPVWSASDIFERVLALDWCWDALDTQVRQEFLLEIRKQAVPLTAADSPLDHRTFGRKLVILAAALAVDQQDDSSPGWARLRGLILDSARQYYETTFPTYVRWRGCAPTSPAAGPSEECDTALALELAAQVLDRDLWPEHRETVGRWLEHYVFASFSHPALQHHFIRDDGNAAPLSPAPSWGGMLPITAHMIAARTGDPAAAFVARRVEQQLRGPAAHPLAVAWQWIPIVFDVRSLKRCDFARLPAARNFGGAVVFRGRRGAAETGIWMEAGQPFLRRRQHFDAGHFLIYSNGHLASGAGDDVAFEAIPSKGGTQNAGGDEDFDFEQYFTSSTAHNCLLLWDPMRVPRWYGKRYEPTGGQRPIEDTCTDFTTPLDDNPRQTARQLAYGQHEASAYLALDLLPAYGARAVKSYTREFVFLAGSALVVVDRVTTSRGLSEPVLIINVPARPSVDGDDLPANQRIAGKSALAGIWDCHDAQALRWSDGDGTLWMFPLMPEDRQLHVAGGPATRQVVIDGPQAGRTYVGGEADGFERLLRPAGHAKPKNAWYHLGAPTLLGPTFGVSPHWGRVEVEPAAKAESQVFVTVFVVEAADATHPPHASVEPTDDAITLHVDTGVEQLLVRLAGGEGLGGTAELEGGAAWTLPSTVEPDGPLPTD